jgi:hypothetical protein
MRGDGIAGSGRVGQQDNPGAPLTQAVEAVDRAGIDCFAVMNDPPQIEDEEVIVAGHPGQAA